jgi:predicted HTH domain antitoxin
VALGAGAAAGAVELILVHPDGANLVRPTAARPLTKPLISGMFAFMNISFDLPNEIEAALRAAAPDPSLAAKESLLVELYRQQHITQHQLAEALGLNRYEVDGLLKRHNVPLDLGVDDFRAEAAALRKHGQP